MNTFGSTLRLTTFGESHGPAIGGVLNGIPPGITVSLAEVARQMERRRPGRSKLTSPRSEADSVEFLSGLMRLGTDGPEALTPDTDMAVTLGTPIGFIIRNNDSRPADYDALRDAYRPSHADFAWEQRYGGVRDWRGGGRSSGRETACRVAAGAIARQLLEAKGVTIRASLTAVGGKTDAAKFGEVISRASAENDSVGGVVECRVAGFFRGVGDPVFGKLQQRLAAAMLSIGGAKGFEYGDGFAIAGLRGSAAADRMRVRDGETMFLSNHSGGIQGGISNGEEIVFRVPFKPTPTIGQPLETINRNGDNIVLESKGRHDPCIALRAVPVVEAMAALALLDAALTDNVSFGR